MKSVLTLAMLCSTAIVPGAIAQTATGSTAPPAAAVSTDAGAEVVVTARKREELSVDVPASVQAFSGATIEKAMTRNVADLYATVPNLYFSPIAISPARDYTTLVIRGIGAQSAGQPAVATFVDGIYQPALAFDTNFLDVESVEVLKGPQGTIFGRNTEGGALNINLRKPGNQLRGRVSAMVDNFGTFATTARMSGPLSDTLSGGASFAASNTDGYLTNPTLGGVSADRSRSFAARVALRYRPTDRLDVNLSVDASNTRGLQGLPGIYLPRRDYQVLSSFQIDALAESVGGSLNIAYDTGPLTVTSLTGYRRLKSDTPYDFAGGPVDGIAYPDEYSDLRRDLAVFSQEFRLSGTALGDRLNWLAGLYGYRERNLEERPLSLAFVPAFGTSYIQPIQTQRLINTGFALFADATYQVVPRLSLDLGLRYGHESVDSDWYHRAVIPGIFASDVGGRDAISSDYVTPSASLLYKFTPTASVYVRYATGQRSGGFPLAPTPSTNIPYRDETSTNIELGTKGTIANGLLSYDVSAFYIKLRNQQVQSIVYINNDPTLPASATTNAGRSSSRGVEGSLTLRPARGWTLTANGGYTDARYDSYIDIAFTDRAGDRFPFVPRFQAAASVEYVMPLPDGRSLTLAGNYQHIGSFLSGSGVRDDYQYQLPAYDKVDLRASLAVTRELSVDAFVNNVFDKYIVTRVFNAFFFPPSRPFATVLPPRNYGARLTYAF